MHSLADMGCWSQSVSHAATPCELSPHDTQRCGGGIPMHMLIASHRHVGYDYHVMVCARSILRNGIKFLFYFPKRLNGNCYLKGNCISNWTIAWNITDDLSVVCTFIHQFWTTNNNHWLSSFNFKKINLRNHIFSH